MDANQKARRTVRNVYPVNASTLFPLRSDSLPLSLCGLGFRRTASKLWRGKARVA